MRERVDERANGERVWDVQNRPKPPDPHMRDRLAVLAADVGNGVRNVENTLAELSVAGVSDIGSERRWNRRERYSMKPCARPTLRVDCCLDVLRVDGMVVVMLYIVLACPLHLDRGAHCACEECRFDNVVGF